MTTTNQETKSARKGMSQLPQETAHAHLRSVNSDDAVTRNGRLERVFDVKALDLKQGHFYSIDGGESFALQASGYYSLNQVAGLQFVEAHTVPAEGGKQMPNPYVQRDSNGRITGVYLRAAMVGRNATGSVMVVSETLFFDPEVWFRLALIKACKTDKTDNWSGAGKMTGRHFQPELQEHHTIYPVDEHTQVILDLRDYRARTLLENRVAVQRDATKRARTVLFRRLATAHPGLPDMRLPRACIDPKSVTYDIRNQGTEWEKRILTGAQANVPVMGWIDRAEDTETLARAFQRGDEIRQASMIDLGLATVDADAEERAQPIAEPAPEAESNLEAVRDLYALFSDLREKGRGDAVNEITSELTVDCGDLSVEELQGLQAKAREALNKSEGA